MIDVEDLRFKYPGTHAPVLNGVSFSVAKGEIYGLLGPSGAGKSTTQKLLMGLLRGYSGSIRLFGDPLETLGRGLYERIGVSFELPALYLRLTARENLALFGALYQGKLREIGDVLELVDLGDAADQRVETFSKGMKMRLNLCRSLLHDPDILFLDEPTTGQDPGRARTTRQLLKKLRDEGKAILLTTHNMTEAEEICDRVGFLVGGEIPEAGSPAALKLEYGERNLDVAHLENGAVLHQIFPMEGIGRNAPFLKLIKENEIVSMHTRDASLDDIFIKIADAAADK